jgi:hypothetical protein
VLKEWRPRKVDCMNGSTASNVEVLVVSLSSVVWMT